MPALKRLVSFSLPILLSLTGAYTAYVFLLQTSGLSRLGRLVAAAIIWGLLFVYLRLRGRGLLRFTSGTGLAGLVAAFLLANLVLAAALTETPYTQPLLPTHSVHIQPLDGDHRVTIQSFSTQLAPWLSIDSFHSNQGWREEKAGISLVRGAGKDLVWQGRPGQYVLIELLTCADCGRLAISFDGQDIEQVDLSQPTPDRTLTIRYDYPSLFWHKALNFFALQATILLLAAITLDAGQALFTRLRRGKDRQVYSGHHPSGYVPPLLIAAFSVVVYGLKIRPILFNDDWCQIVSWLNYDTIAPFMLGERRPLNMFLPWLFDQFLPLEGSVFALYLSLLVILTLTAILVYYLVLELAPGWRWIALLAALLWLVFPNDYTRAYITMIGIRTAYLLMILVMILVLRFTRDGSFPAILLASACLFASFFIYEGQLGLALAWSILCLYLYRPQDMRERTPGLLVYGASVGVFTIWRLFIQPSYYADAKLDTINLETYVILGRYIQALPTILGGFRTPYPEYSWTVVGGIAILILAGICILLALIWVRRTWSREPELDAIEPILPTNGRLMLAGAVIWLAGYFPIILNFPPNIYGHLSRVNIFSILGAILILLALLWTFMLTVTGNPRSAAAGTSLLVLPLLFVGAAVQIQVQDSNILAWEDTKIFYRKLVEVVPDIAPETQVVFLLTAEPAIGEAHRPIFSASWEAECAVRTLYDQPDLEVMYRYESIVVPPFPASIALAGAMETDTIGAVRDPAKLLVLEYDRATRSLRVHQGAVGIFQDETAEGYAPEERILPLQREIPSRKLIE